MTELAVMHSSFNKKIEALIAEITAAFDGVSRDGGLSLHEAYVCDSYAYDPECEMRVEARAKDNETRWQDVPLPTGEYGDYEYKVALSYFDPIGFRYYLPRYMIGSIETMRWFAKYEYPEIPDEWPELWPIGPNSYLGVRRGGWDSSENDMPRFALLTFEQSRAVAHYLVFSLEFSMRQRKEQEEWLKREQKIKERTWYGNNIKREYSRAFRYWGQFL